MPPTEMTIAANDNATAAIEAVASVWRSVIDSPTDAETSKVAHIVAIRAMVEATRCAADSADTSAEAALRVATSTPDRADVARAAFAAKVRASAARDAAKLAADWAIRAERIEVAEFMRNHQYAKRVCELSVQAARAAADAANWADAATLRAARSV